ncbi:helix-turn-helix transcriptional regulator [Celeribacter marinus]|uniref:Transcriptional regulator, DeoR family n=1 Tax=Celeribacter marinus TaxID=1397108 RepID=A0A0P0A6N6_9RHOB|nr:YafY family protein [Celeribacter marinus]ALI56354.1 transcriptional regulator, DeoR family [Celeribacter marinus]SFK45203.1 HTH domain-containing protein [Celeribacter marinus]
MAGGRKQTGIRRSDRLFDLIQILRDGRLHTARQLAERVEVSERTIWRDMATLKASGVPVEGERGVGYMITAAITLPPVNLTMGELEALHLAVAILGEASDPELAKSAASLAAKIDAVLPENSGPPEAGWGFAVHPYAFADARAGFKHMPALRDGVREQKVLRVSYLSLSGEKTTRLVRPLQLNYWGRVWTLSVWCDLRGGFRTFRVDRIDNVIDTGATFKPEAGKTLADFIAYQTAQHPHD